MDPLKTGIQQSLQSESETMESTGERYLPWEKDPVMAYEHWHRYAYVSQFVQGKRALDLASGEGYGSALLAQTARLVVGIDIDERTVQHACRKYPGANRRFLVGSVTDIPLKSQFDFIVCFEVIEHIRDHDRLLSEVKRLMAPGGLFLLSTPNKPEYRLLEPSNPYHVKELDFEELRMLLSRHFQYMQFLGQRVYCNSNLWTIGRRPIDPVPELLMDRNADGFFTIGADNRDPMYFIGAASDSEIPPIATGTILVDSSNSLLREKDRIQREQGETINSQMEALAWREGQIQQFQAAIRSHEEALAWRESQIKDQQLENDHQRKHIEALGKRIEALEEEMRILQSGRGWRLIQKFLRFRDRVLPAPSLRRKIYNRIIGKIDPLM